MAEIPAETTPTSGTEEVEIPSVEIPAEEEKPEVHRLAATFRGAPQAGQNERKDKASQKAAEIAHRAPPGL